MTKREKEAAAMEKVGVMMLFDGCSILNDIDSLTLEEQKEIAHGSVEAWFEEFSRRVELALAE